MAQSYDAVNLSSKVTGIKSEKLYSRVYMVFNLRYVLVDPNNSFRFSVTKLNLSYYIDDAKRRTEGGSKMKDLLKNLDDVKKRVKIIEESEISVMAGCVNE